MEIKICSICKEEKELKEYDKKKKWYLSYCKECRKNKRKQYYKEHREEEIKRTKEYQRNNKEKLKITTRIYQEKNKEHIKEYNKNWEKEHKDYRNAYANKLQTEKKKKDKIYKLKCQVRTMLATSFKRKKYKKNSRTEKIVGCKWNFFINYLLQTFKKNYGYEWDGKEKISIDHIIPLSQAQTEEDVIKLCHYTNLQLLKTKDNLEKSNKLNWELLK